MSCSGCDRRGSFLYGTGATYMLQPGQMATANMKQDVCNRCWGSGDERRPGVDLAKLRAELAEARERAERALFEKAAALADGRVTMIPDVLGGVPCVRGTRIPVHTILAHYLDGFSREQILNWFSPALSEEQIDDALRFASLVTGGAP